VRVSEQRIGEPDLSRAGFLRGSYQRRRFGGGPRKGYPDRSRRGAARSVDLRPGIRKRVRQQVGEAQDIPIIDEAGKYTATDVEGALFELKGNFESVDGALVDPTTFLQQEGSYTGGMVSNGGDQDWGGYDIDNAGDIETVTVNGLTPVGRVGPVSFTATSTFTHRHALGFRPQVVVINSSGREVGVCVDHLDADTVRTSFTGTLNGAKLLYI
jgi:hypothetical protein